MRSCKKGRFENVSYHLFLNYYYHDKLLETLGSNLSKTEKVHCILTLLAVLKQHDICYISRRELK